MFSDFWCTSQKHCFIYRCVHTGTIPQEPFRLMYEAHGSIWRKWGLIKKEKYRNNHRCDRLFFDDITMLPSFIWISAQTFTWYPTNLLALYSSLPILDMKEKAYYFLLSAQHGLLRVQYCCATKKNKKCMDNVPRVNLHLCLLFFLFF